MSKLSRCFIAVVVAVGFGLVLCPVASAVTWFPWAVGSGSTVVNGDGSITFTAGSSVDPVWVGGQKGNKAFYSTDNFNGRKVKDLIELNYTLVDPPDPTGLSAPYLNVVVTDGTDFTFLLLDAMPIPFGQQKHVFSTAQYRGGEGTGSLAAWNNVWKLFDDVKDLFVAGGFSANPSAVAPIVGWAGSGANDGIALVWGNRGGADNYKSPVKIKDVSLKAVPEPSTMLLLGFGLIGLVGLRRKLGY